ncbi:MAG: ABC transporter permease [Pseudomonadota bacterium]|nr:ABC transporter permease [Pseudomonadota bacterium]
MAEPARSTLYFMRRALIADRFAMFGAGLIVLFVLAALFAPWLAPYGPDEADPSLRLQGIGTPGHLLGLDNHGRDVLSRVIYGTRFSLVAGVTPVLLGALIAVPLGLIAAYYERVGHLIMRTMDILFAFPMVLLAIMLAFFLGPGLVNLIIALVVVLVPYNTRVVYVQAQAERDSGYVEAARAAATSDLRIMFVEMLPHVIAASVVYSMTIVGTIIVTAAGLSFLGLGVQPPTAEWGIMTSEGRTVLHIAPHASTVPGIAIFLLVIGFNLVGDSLRDALDPRTRLLRVRLRPETEE